MTTHNILLAILGELDDLLFDESRWTRGAQARLSSGALTSPFDRDAAAWCLTGAINRVCVYRIPYDQYECKLKALFNSEVGPVGVEIFNDNSRFDEVKALIDVVRMKVVGGDVNEVPSVLVEVV